MKRSISIVSGILLFCLLAGPLTPSMLLAQDDNAKGQLLNVQTWRVDPSDAPAQDALIRQIVQAANEAKLKGPNTTWYFWSSDFNYTLVYPFENFAVLDTPNQFEKRFAGTPGEATLKAAFEGLEKIPTMDTKSTVIMTVPDWNYAPESAAEVKGAEVNEYWIETGQREAFDALAKDALALFEDVKYPYEVAGNRIIFGDVDRTVFVTFYDNKANYYGENDLTVLIKKAGREDDWGRINERFLQIVSRTTSNHINSRPELTFIGAALTDSDSMGGSN